MRLRIFLILLAGLTLSSPGAHAATKEDGSACGKTVEDKLAAAREALASNDTAISRAAIACLIEAVSTLEAQKLEAVRNDGTHTIAVPHAAGPIP